MELTVVVTHGVPLQWLWDYAGSISILTSKQMLLSKKTKYLFFQFEVSLLVQNFSSFQDWNNFGLCKLSLSCIQQCNGLLENMSALDQFPGLLLADSLHYLGVYNVIPRVRAQEIRHEQA